MDTGHDGLQIDLSPLVDLVAAHWQVHCSKARPMLGPRPLVTPPMLARFLSRACVDTPDLTEVLTTLGLRRAVAIAGREFERYDAVSPAEDRAAASLRTILDDSNIQDRCRAAQSELIDDLGIALGPVRTMHERSRYAESPTLLRVMGADLEIRVIPSTTLPPAPNGKAGFYRAINGHNRLTLVFGFANHVNLEAVGYIDWPQWWRLGIWHFLGRLYWTRRIDQLALSDSEQDRLFSLIPNEFLNKVGIHESTISRNSTWRAYFLDQLIGATKVIGEEEVAGSASAAGQRKWFSSLGRFHVQWFVERLRGRAFEDIAFGDLLAEWVRDLPRLTGRSPIFGGPLGACENPLWNQNRSIRLYFSPSVSELTRRILRKWFTSFWPVPPTFDHGNSSPEVGAPRTCHLVFGLWRDREWLAGFHDGVRATIAATGASQALRETLAQPAPAASLVYTGRNLASQDCWHRVCLAADDDALQAIHRQAHHYSDWTAILNGARLSGLSLHLEDLHA